MPVWRSKEKEMNMGNKREGMNWLPEQLMDEDKPRNRRQMTAADEEESDALQRGV
jgi:hypothetical protein